MGAKVASTVMSALLTAAMPVPSAAQNLVPQVRVMLQNDGVVPADQAEPALAEVARLYALIDVAVVWVPNPDENVLSIKVTMWEPREDEYPHALGMTPALLGKRPTRAYVFWGRVQRCAQKYAAGFDALLAVAIAHEIGHMLLSSGHSERGLMHHSWDSGHFRAAAAGLLHFSPESADRIRRALSPDAARAR